MHSSEAHASFTDGCQAHGRGDCLCDVQPIPGGVPIRAVPEADRLMELGLNRLALVIWAEELSAREAQARTLRLVVEV